MDMADWIDNGGSVGCESPQASEEVHALHSGASVVHYHPTPDGYRCSCDQEFVSFEKFARHATEGGVLHTLPAKSSAADPINHPPHYTFGKIEVIDVIEDWGLSFHLAQVVKYVARSKHKGKELEDLRKAQFYLNRLITSLEK